MIEYNSGEIVLLKFPFSDTSNIKKSPALIILDTEDNDIIVLVLQHNYIRLNMMLLLENGNQQVF